MDRLTKDQRSKNMKAVRSKGSVIERILGKELYKAGLRYRKNDNDIFGKPDFTFRRAKVAVFCDSEFWHGKDLKNGQNMPKSNLQFWKKKLERNVARDKEVNHNLRKEGWKVLRFWSKDIIENTLICVNKIQRELECRKKLLKP